MISVPFPSFFALTAVATAVVAAALGADAFVTLPSV